MHLIIAPEAPRSHYTLPYGSLIYVSVAPWLILCKYTEDAAVLQLLLARYCAHIISELVNFRYLFTGCARHRISRHTCGDDGTARDIQ